jgi:arylsulfatase A-like enzyme
LELEVQCREQDLLRQPSRVLFTQGAVMSVDMVGEEKFRFVLATYIRLIEWIDSEVGRIVKTLRDLGLDEDTAIFFTADHGDEGGFNGIYGKARACKSEGITAVPFVVRPPKNLLTVPADRKYINEPVEVVDIFATICSLAGIEAPKGVQGVSLAEVISGARDEDLTRAVFCESFDQKSLKKEGWKLVFDREDDRDCFLFDMNNDPDQLCDLYNDKSMLKKRIELKREIFSRLMQNVHGDYDAFDVQRLERGLNPKDPLIPCVIGSVTLSSLRCAAYIRHEEYTLLVRYYSDEILMFKGKSYPTSEMAIEADLEIVDRMLDEGIRECSNKISYVSILRGGA